MECVAAIVACIFGWQSFAALELEKHVHALRVAAAVLRVWHSIYIMALDLDHAAIDRNDLAGNISGLRRCQKCD